MKKNINHQNKLLESIISLSILLVAVQITTLIGLFLFSFRGIEEYVLRQNLKSSVDTLQLELARINGVIFEWSAWDDTARFVEGKNPDFASPDMVDATILQQNLNVICIVDLEGKPLLTRCVKIQDNKLTPVELSLFDPEILPQNRALWNHKNPDSYTAGYYSTEGGALMLSSRPVTNNENTGPIRGAVLMGRFITDDFVTSIAKQTCLDFQWWSLRTEYARKALSKYLSLITDENPLYVEFNPKTATAYTLLRDNDGKDAVLIKFVMANEVSSLKEGYQAKCIGIYATEGIVFILYLAAFTSKHCWNCRQQTDREIQLAADVEYRSFEQMAETQSDKEEKLPVMP